MKCTKVRRLLRAHIIWYDAHLSMAVEMHESLGADKQIIASFHSRDLPSRHYRSEHHGEL